jgi:hypothetical protein
MKQRSAIPGRLRTLSGDEDGIHVATFLGMDDSRLHNWGESLLAGLAGALALTTVHQLARRMTSSAPRMDVLGERAIVATSEAVGKTPPSEPAAYRLALAGDIIANSAYYSLIACGRSPRLWSRAVPMGIGAGVGALVLPQRIGLGIPPRSWERSNQAMTVAWYLIGALATACTAECLRGRYNEG